MEALARKIAGTNADPETQALARQIAEAQIDLRRIRYARHKLLSGELNEPCYGSAKTVREKCRLVSSLLCPNAPDIPTELVTAYLTTTLEGPEKFATILSEQCKKLLAMDRYERRALSRRNKAIRAFDEWQITR
jgi:hypothetical protein